MERWGHLIPWGQWPLGAWVPAPDGKSREARALTPASHSRCTKDLLQLPPSGLGACWTGSFLQAGVAWSPWGSHTPQAAPYAWLGRASTVTLAGCQGPRVPTQPSPLPRVGKQVPMTLVPRTPRAVFSELWDTGVRWASPPPAWHTKALGQLPAQLLGQKDWLAGHCGPGTGRPEGRAGAQSLSGRQATLPTGMPAAVLGARGHRAGGQAAPPHPTPADQGLSGATAEGSRAACRVCPRRAECAPHTRNQMQGLCGSQSLLGGVKGPMQGRPPPRQRCQSGLVLS